MNRLTDQRLTAEAIAAWNTRPGDAAIEAAQKVADAYRAVMAVKHKNGCLFAQNPHSPCQCGFRKRVAEANVNARELVAALAAMLPAKGDSHAV